MNILQFLNEQSILIPLAAGDKNEIIGEMARSLEAAGVVTDKAAFLEAVLARENTGSTGIGFQVAIPHGKSAGVAQAGIAFAKLASPVDWQSLDGQPVQAVFMIAVPEAAAGNDHLKILISLSRKLIDDDFRSSLLAVSDAEQLKQLLATI